MKELPVLNSRVLLRNKRVLLRVDWNIPVEGMPSKEDLAKIESSVPTIRYLQKHGAITIILTHLGRPKKREEELSTARLLPLAEAYLENPLMFCGEDIMTKEGMAMVYDALGAAEPGDLFLMENVRFYSGEDKNDKSLSQAYASLADYFVNDAFASSHRAHVSVAGVSAMLPHFAGPQLVREIEAARRLIEKPRKPFIAIVGGSKLSTKMPVIESLLKTADKVLIGGAMAHPFFAAKKMEIGKSYMEEEGIKYAKKIIKNPKLVLPVDALVANKLDKDAKPKCVPVGKIGKKDIIGDIGTTTMREWSGIINKAQTILWNGPVGVTKLEPFSFGSLLIGRVMAARSKGKAYGLVGGGDTVPVALQTGMADWFDHISMGGGALLEFIEKKGKLPGIEALYRQTQGVGQKTQEIRRKQQEQSRKFKVVSHKSTKLKSIKQSAAKGKAKKAVVKNVKKSGKKTASRSKRR